VQTNVSLFKRFRLIPLSERVLLLLFLLTLPLANPWVRGDGVGYYAFARALLIQHNLDFAPDYQHATPASAKAALMNPVSRARSTAPPRGTLKTTSPSALRFSGRHSC